MDAAEAIGLGSAVTSLAALLFGIYKHRVAQEARRPKLDVKAQFGIGVHYASGPGDSLVLITVANTGEIPVIVTGVGLVLPEWLSGDWMVWPRPDGDRALPTELQPRHSATYFYSLEVVLQALRTKQVRGTIPVRAFARDAVGATHLAEAQFELDTELRALKATTVE